MTYPIGTPGVPWGAAEKAAWLERQTRKRSYADEVLSARERLAARYDAEQYGLLEYGRIGPLAKLVAAELTVHDT